MKDDKADLTGHKRPTERLSMSARKARRRLATFACLLCILCSAVVRADTTQNFLVFGDSLTSPNHSWANLIHKLEIANFQISAQPGLRMIDIDAPRHIRPYGGEWGAVIWLGTNDAGSGLSPDQVAMYTRPKVAFLQSRGFRVYLVLPVYFPNHPRAQLMQTMRDTITEIAHEYGAEILDPPFPYDTAADGIHPSPQGHVLLASYFIDALRLTWDCCSQRD